MDRPGQRKSSDRPLGELLPLSPQFSRVPALRLPAVLITQVEGELGGGLVLSGRTPLVSCNFSQKLQVASFLPSPVHSTVDGPVL